MRLTSCFAVMMVFLLCPPGSVAQEEGVPARDYARVPHWMFPSATLDEGVIRIWNNDTLLCDIEMLTAFVAGEEFIVSHRDLYRLSTRYWYETEENGVLTRHRQLRPVITVPLRTFFLPEDPQRKSFLYTTARPDSLYMVGVNKNGDWFFQRMQLGQDDLYVPVSWYYQKRTGAVYCSPPDHPKPWKYIEKRSRDL